MTAFLQRSWKANRPTLMLVVLGVVQVVLWIGVASLAPRFAFDIDVGRRPLLTFAALLGVGFAVYLASLGLVWNAPAGQRARRTQAWGVVLFALLMRLPLWWSQPIQEIDLYRYLWDGRVLQAGVSPYHYSPAQVEEALEKGSATPELERLTTVLERSPEIAEAFFIIHHREVPTIYPPLSQGVFAIAAVVTPERAPLPAQVRIMKGILLLFDLATIGLVMGLLCNLGLPTARALAYAWCPLVLKEFANAGHLDSIAVCLTTATLWWVTRPALRGNSVRALTSDWLASGLWAAAVLAKLYPLVLAPVLLMHAWRRLRWRTVGPVVIAALVLLAGYGAVPHGPTPATVEDNAVSAHSSLTGLGEFLEHWEMNDLLFSVVFENVRSIDPDSRHQLPWYSVLPMKVRDQLDTALVRLADHAGFRLPPTRLTFMFTQMLAAGGVFVLACWLALKRWPEDPRGELLRRAFLCLAWMWFLSATQNPWYWTWAMPLVVFASRAWLLVSGFALIYYLRFWFVDGFPDSTLPGGLDGRRFFDEVVVWFEHLPPLLAVLCAAVISRKHRVITHSSTRGRAPAANATNVIVVIPALNEEASLPDVLARLRAVGLDRIRIVDNGSQDRTADVAQRCGAEVIHEPRRGYGQACWAGCETLPGGIDWILFCNADGSDDIERAPSMLTDTREGREFVLGMRTAGEDGRDHLTPPQRFGNMLAVGLIRLLWGARYHDLGPLRLISRNAFERLRLRDRGFGWTVEMQVRAVEEGLPYREVPVRSLARSAGVSKISGTFKGSIPAGTIILATIAALWWRRA